MRSWLAAFLGCAAFLVIAAAPLAWGMVGGDGRGIAGWDAKAARPADNTGASGRDGVPEEIGDRGADGAGGPAGAQGDQGPEGDNGEPDADGDKGALGATGPSGPHRGPRGEGGAPGAMGDNGHARAPPAVLSAPRTGPGA